MQRNNSNLTLGTLISHPLLFFFFSLSLFPYFPLNLAAQDADGGLGDERPAVVDLRHHKHVLHHTGALGPLVADGHGDPVERHGQPVYAAVLALRLLHAKTKKEDEEQEEGKN